jgi:hypothetical protein
MSLAANDLPIRSTATTPTTQSTLDPFDYASARLDLNDARERKLRADDLLHKYASSFTKSSFKYSKNNTSSSAAITTTHEALAREVDRRIAMVAQALGSSRKGRRVVHSTSGRRPTPNARTPGRSTSARDVGVSGSSKKLNSRKTNRRGIFSPHRRQQQQQQTPQRKVMEVDDFRPTATSSVGQLLMNRASRRSSVRPAELVGIRTIPKPEIPVVRQVPRRKKWKQATPNVVDKRRPKIKKKGESINKVKSRIHQQGSTERNLVLLAAASPPKPPEMIEKEEEIGGPRNSQGQESWGLGGLSEQKKEQYEMRQMAEEETEVTSSRQQQQPIQQQQPPVVRVTSSKRFESSNVTSKNNSIYSPSDVGAITREISAALREHYHETERRLVDVENRERQTAEAYRLAMLACDHEREIRAAKEDELNRAHDHVSDMLSAVDALREANTSLEVTNSALVEQVDKVHNRASVAEQESLRLWRTQLKKEEVALGLSDNTVREMADNLPYEQMILDVVTSLIVENVYNENTGCLLSDDEMKSRGLLIEQVTSAISTISTEAKKQGNRQNMVNKVEVKEDVKEEVDSDGDDGDYEDEFEEEEVVEAMEEKEEKEEKEDLPKAPKGKIIDPPTRLLRTNTTLAREVDDEDLYSDEETYVDRQKQVSKNRYSNKTTEMYSSSSSSSSQENKSLFAQLMEEKIKRELMEKELKHREEKEMLNKQLLEMKFKQEKHEYESNQKVSAIINEKLILQEQLSNELKKRNEMEVKIEELIDRKIALPTHVPTTKVSTAVSGSSLGAMLNAKKAEVLHTIVDGSVEDSVEVEDAEGTLTNVSVSPDETKEQQNPSGVPLVFLQPTHMHPLAPTLQDKKKQYDDLLSDYST